MSESEHPSAESRDLKPDDRLLRRHGFRIVSRPKGGPNLWSRGGVVRPEDEALRACRNAEEARANGERTA
ncbi:MAG TPA: hypothetical protein VD931_01035 [Baekduia sp.]|nr:hypothetical protein [Baekduia sp.]